MAGSDPQQLFRSRAYLDFGGGAITDVFTHLNDASDILLVEEVPQSGADAGGVFPARDGRTAPDTIHASLGSPGGFVVTCEGMLVPGAAGAGIEIADMEGRLTAGQRVGIIPRDGGGKADPVTSSGDSVTPFVRNLLDCMGSPNRPNGEVADGHRSAQASQLATLAYLQRRPID